MAIIRAKWAAIITALLAWWSAPSSYAPDIGRPDDQHMRHREPAQHQVIPQAAEQASVSAPSPIRQIFASPSPDDSPDEIASTYAVIAPTPRQT